MKNRSGEKIKLTSIDELLGVVNEESAMEIEIDKIKSFAGHPFKVIDDEKMQNLIESISESGVLTPVLIRPDQNDGYEMISGHRRMHAAQKAGLITIPAIVREMTDDEAVIAMVDANIQREELLPSEKAFAYKMKMEAMKRQGARIDLTCAQNDHKLGKKSREILGEQIGISSAQIQRYIRLTELIPDLLELVDKKRLNFTIAVDISYIPQDVQKWIYEYICDNGFIKPNQIAALRNYLGQAPVTQSLMISILNSHIPVKAPARKVTLNEKKLTKYFPKNYTSEDMEKVIESLLEKLKQEQEVK
ncbi:MAG: ParB/RepB/Spo0J family partition protein [Lachnospiraceae bacterium]|nr:ParB/RepB/Spo0J family partition protein [Lachnospiraceae bacterium]